MMPSTFDLSFARQWLDAAIGNPVQTPPRVTLRRQGWDFLRYDCSIVDAPLTLAGKVFKRGLGTHADSEIRIRANQPIREFRAWAGMDDNPDCRNANPGNPKRMLFAVEAGGRELWRSAPLGVADQPARVEVAAEGATELLLKAWDVNGKINHTHADWADAEVGLSAGDRHWLPDGGRFEKDGLVSFHAIAPNRGGIMYARCAIDAPVEMLCDLLLGTDGPLKVWLDGTEVGIVSEAGNPAVPDKFRFPVTLTRGRHTLIVAQDRREGRAWGFFLRLVRTDLNLTTAERHSGDICVPNIKENDHA